MKNILLIGSTGMIGSLILHKCLQRSDVAKVISITRRKTGVEHAKLLEIVLTDFLNFRAVRNDFQNIDICFYCVGVYTGTVSREEFRKITVDYTKAFASILKKESPNATFCFLSGQGADQTEKSRMMFAKDKGIAENYLLQTGFAHSYIFRPGYIYPVTPRKEPTFAYRVMRLAYPFLNLVYKSGVITSSELANAMVAIGFTGGSKNVYENKEIRKLEIKNEN